MPLISTLGAASSRGFGEFNQQASGKYIEDYFSTYTYTGNGGTQTIGNGIGLADTASWSSFTQSQNDTEIYGVTTDSSGNFYTVGRNNDGTRQVATTVKYNSAGVVQWQRKWYQSGWTPYGFGVKVDSSGNVFLCGSAYDGTRYNGIVIKYNSSGVIQWYRKMYAGQTYIRNVCFDTSGNIYGVGYHQPSTDYYIYIVKLDSSGAIVWERRLYENASFGYGIGIDTSNNIYISGFANDSNRQYGIIAKYDSNGTIQWQKKTYEGTYTSSARSLFVDSSNNIFVGGIAFDGTQTHATIQKFDTSGNRAWSRKFYQGTSYGYGVTADASGNSYLIGSVSSNQQWFVSKYNSSGVIQWQRTMSYPSNYGVANSVAADSSGNIFIAGGFTDLGPGNTVGIVAKILADGSSLSGQAYISMAPGSGTDAVGGQTLAGGTALDQATSTTTSTTGATDADGTLATATFTQAAVTGGAGLVWIKSRDSDGNHAMFDTKRPVTQILSSNLATVTTNSVGYGLTSFNAGGFSLNATSFIGVNNSATKYVSWTFRESTKFFKIITYTGNGTNFRNIAHDLGGFPGMVIVRRTNETSVWSVVHSAYFYNAIYGYTGFYLNQTNPVGNTTTDDTGISFNATNLIVSNSTGANFPSVNATGVTYVAYLFANDAGGFGADQSQSVIKTGNFTTDGSGNATVTLGFEPQFAIIKCATTSASWQMFDVNRNWSNGSNNDMQLIADGSNAESYSERGYPTATGFNYSFTAAPNQTFVYVAIRRGLMKTPTSGTTVFQPVARSGTGTNDVFVPTTITPDLAIIQKRNATSYSGRFYDRSLGVGYIGGTRTDSNQLVSNSTSPTSVISYGLYGFDVMNGYVTGNDVTVNSASGTYGNLIFRRARGFMDIVNWQNNGSLTQTVPHNLGVVPELIIAKRLQSGTDGWFVYMAPLGATKAAILNTTAAAVTSSSYWNNTAPTSTAFTTGGNFASSEFYAGYLFASCPGVSKIGTYSGTGATQTIDCGFSGGARFVMIKRTDSTGSWWTWDTARGMVAGTDPRLSYNAATAETNNNWVYTTTGGFQVVTNDSTVNVAPFSTWTTQTSSFGTSNITWITYGGGYYLAVGQSGKYATSTNGTSWTQGTAFGQIMITCAYGNSLYLVAGAAGYVYTSPDRTTWTGRSSNLSVSGDIYSSYYGNSLFLIGNSIGEVATSPDGITWTPRTVSFGANPVTGFAYGAGLYVAVGWGGNIATSPDGVTWTARSGGVGTTNLRGVTFANGQFVIVGNSGTILTSPDGITWTSRTSGSTGTLFTVVYGGGYYLVGGSGGETISSTDGITWTRGTSSLGNITALSAESGLPYIIAGTSGALSTTTTPLATYFYMAIA